MHHQMSVLKEAGFPSPRCVQAKSGAIVTYCHPLSLVATYVHTRMWSPNSAWRVKHPLYGMLAGMGEPKCPRTWVRQLCSFLPKGSPLEQFATRSIVVCHFHWKTVG